MRLDEEQLAFLDALYRRMRLAMNLYACRVLGDAALAEEAVQESFRIACSRPEAVMGSENPDGWMMNVLKNVIRNVKRAVEVQNRLIARAMEEIDARAPREGCPSVEYADLIPEEDFALLWQVICERSSVPETAAELGISAEVCRKRVQRAKQKLRRKLEEQD